MVIGGGGITVIKNNIFLRPLSNLFYFALGMSLSFTKIADFSGLFPFICWSYALGWTMFTWSCEQLEQKIVSLDKAQVFVQYHPILFLIHRDREHIFDAPYSHA